MPRVWDLEARVMFNFSLAVIVCRTECRLQTPRSPQIALPFSAHPGFVRHKARERSRRFGFRSAP